MVVGKTPHLTVAWTCQISTDYQLFEWLPTLSSFDQKFVYLRIRSHTGVHKDKCVLILAVRSAAGLADTQLLLAGAAASLLRKVNRKIYSKYTAKKEISQTCRIVTNWTCCAGQQAWTEQWTLLCSLIFVVRQWWLAYSAHSNHSNRWLLKQNTSQLHTGGGCVNLWLLVSVAVMRGNKNRNKELNWKKKNRTNGEHSDTNAVVRENSIANWSRIENHLSSSLKSESESESKSKSKSKWKSRPESKTITKNQLKSGRKEVGGMESFRGGRT